MLYRKIMKSAAALALVFLVFSVSGFGQTRKHDLSLGYGVLTIDQVADILEDLVLITVTLGTFGKTDMEFTGAPFLTYHYSKNSRLGYGIAVGGYQTKGTFLHDITKETAGDFKETNIIGALEIDYHWIMKKGFQLYSGIGAGIRIRKGTYNVGEDTETSSQTFPTFHLNLLGFRLGKNIAFFGEIGAGYKGIFCIGLNGQF